MNIKEYHKIESGVDFKHHFRLLDAGGAYPVYISVLTEEEHSKLKKEQNSISRKMQRFYFKVIIEQIIEWNKTTEYFLDEDTGIAIVDKDLMDYFLRSAMYCVKIKTEKGSVRTPKTLKMNKANRKEVLDYFELIIRVMAVKGLAIQTIELGDLKSLIEQENR